MAEIGILHQSSRVNTPPQNDATERKYRRLLVAVRALIFQMKVPKQFWADAILTACFLINRILSSILDCEIPYLVLFLSQSLIPMKPSIFGCICFVRDVRPQVSKSNHKYLKCDFLGYSRLQQGYKCYSPALDRYLNSAEVYIL